jgi:hypothetical protein
MSYGGCSPSARLIDEEENGLLGSHKYECKTRLD